MLSKKSLIIAIMLFAVSFTANAATRQEAIESGAVWLESAPVDQDTVTPLHVFVGFQPPITWHPRRYCLGQVLATRPRKLYHISNPENYVLRRTRHEILLLNPNITA